MTDPDLTWADFIIRLDGKLAGAFVDELRAVNYANFLLQVLALNKEEGEVRINGTKAIPPPQGMVPKSMLLYWQLEEAHGSS